MEYRLKVTPRAELPNPGYTSRSTPVLATSRLTFFVHKNGRCFAKSTRLRNARPRPRRRRCWRRRCRRRGRRQGSTRLCLLIRFRMERMTKQTRRRALETETGKGSPTPRRRRRGNPRTRSTTSRSWFPQVTESTVGTEVHVFVPEVKELAKRFTHPTISPQARRPRLTSTPV